MAAAVDDGQAVYQAVREGNVESVTAYLEAGGDPNLCNTGTGRTLLHTASREGYPAVVSLLLSKGANPGATTLRHLTPLHLACHQGHLKVARLLLEAFAPVDDRDEAGTAPLHLSAQKGHVDVVRLLLQCGADKDAVDESGWTPVFFSSWKGHAAVTRMLLQAGANARTCDGRDKVTPLHLACSWGQLEVAEVLLEFGADSSAKDCNGGFPEDVIGAASPDVVDPACARELSEVVVGHRLRIKGGVRSEFRRVGHARPAAVPSVQQRGALRASASLQYVVDSLRAKVSELEDQLARAGRERLEVMAYSSDRNRAKFTAALKPECPVCQVEVKEAVLDPCRHLAACAACAGSLERCPFCACPVQGFQLLESRQVYKHILALEDEAAGLRAQLKRFSRRVRDLVAGNGDLKLDVRRARAEILVLNAERKGLEERFLLRTPSLPPTPPVGDIAPRSDRSDEPAPHGGGEGTSNESAAKDGSVDEAGWVQLVGNGKNGGEEATAGDTSCAGANLDHANPAGGGDHAEPENSLTHDEGNHQVDGASTLELGLRVVAVAGGGDGGRFEATGVEASALTVEVSGRRGDDNPGYESSSRSESDADTWASIDRKVRSRSPRSSDRRVFDSCDDSASSECDARETPAAAKLAEPGSGAICGESVGTVQPAFDKDLELDFGRPCRRRVFATLSLPSNLLGACFGADQSLGIEDMGGSGMSAEPTQPRSTSLPGSFLAARAGGHEEARSITSRAATSTPGSQLEGRGASLAKYDGVADGSSSDELSNSQVEGGIWSSASFIAAEAKAGGIGGDDNKGEAQAMANFMPLDKASSAATQPRARRQPRGNKDQHIINYFLDDSSQSSTGSRSPGG